MTYICNIFTKILLITVALLALLCEVSFAAQIKNLTVLAEPNMVSALTKIARIYSQKNGVIVSISFAASDNLINDIDAGEPSDVFISAHQDWIANLKQKGLIDIYNISHVASDELVLVTSQDNLSVPNYLLEKRPELDEALQVLDHSHSILIIDNEGSSLGQYSDGIMNALQLHEIKLFKRLGEDKSSLMTLINNNIDSYAILLASQVSGRKEFKILSRKKHQNIFYQALVIAGDNMESAREFLKFLKSSQAKAIFRESGFVVE